MDVNLSYAETHYKFKLPWSPLYRKWPEFVVDAPYQCIKDQILTFFFVAKDAHLFPCTWILEKLHFQVKGAQSTSIHINQTFALDQAFQFIAYECPVNLEPGHYEFWFEGFLQKSDGTRLKLWNHNFPRLESWSVQVHLLANTLPKLPGWLSGETHCHTHFTSDQVEFGASPWVYQKAASQLGLDFVICTDHSYDFEWDSESYLSAVNGQIKFDDLAEQLRQLNLTHGPRMILGQEVSCGNYLDQNVHLLVHGFPNFIRGQGDGGRRWLQNKPDHSIVEVLEMAQGYPCFAAHPKVAVSVLEKMIFRRGMWYSKDLHSKLNGIQFASGSWNPSALAGEKYWLESLQNGHRLLPIGGSDAHGDLNANYGMHIPLIKLKASRSFLFGKMRTWIPAQHNEYSILQALQRGQSTASNGPLLSLEKLSQGLLITVIQGVEYSPLLILKIGFLQDQNWLWSECNLLTYEYMEVVDIPRNSSLAVVQVWDSLDGRAVSIIDFGFF